MGKRLLLAVCFVLSPALAHSAANNQFDFSLDKPADIPVTQGGSHSTTLTARYVAGTSRSISFTVSGLPQNTTASFSSASCTPTCSTTLTISTLASTPTGTYTITVAGKAGQLRRTTGFQLTVNPAPLDFSLTKPADIVVTQGGSTSTTISATLVSGTPQPVAFSASGLPTPPAFS